MEIFDKGAGDLKARHSNGKVYTLTVTDCCQALTIQDGVFRTISTLPLEHPCCITQNDIDLADQVIGALTDYSERVVSQSKQLAVVA